MGKDDTSGCDVLIWIRDIAETTGRCPGQAYDIKDCPHRGWGRKECPPDFKIIHIPDKSRADLEYLLKSDEETYINSAEEDMMKLPPQPKTHLKKRRRFNLDQLKPKDRNDIKRDLDVNENTMVWSKIGATEKDDIASNLKLSFAWRSRIEELNYMHAEIAAGLRPAPPNYVKTERDISSYLAEIDARMDAFYTVRGYYPTNYIKPADRTAP
jgi:hypothetical protein